MAKAGMITRERWRERISRGLERRADFQLAVQ
jgi:hypothetical protein